VTLELFRNYFLQLGLLGIILIDSFLIFICFSIWGFYGCLVRGEIGLKPIKI